MRNVFRYILIVILLLTTSYRFLSANEMKKLAQTGFQFLKIDPDARGAAMAGAQVAVANDANAVFWNPAGIAKTQGIAVSLNQTNWFADIKQNAIAAVMPYKNWGYFGISFVNVNYGDIPVTRIAENEAGYVEEGSYGPGGLALGLVYARQFTDRLSIGGQVKYAYEHLGSNTVQRQDGGDIKSVDNTLGALAFDLGTLYYTGFKDFRISMSIRNFSKQIEYETEGFQMPLTFAVGFAMNVLSLTDLGDQHTLTIAMDAIHPRDYSERLHVGAEYMFMNFLALRAGYKINYDEEGFSGGFGLQKALASFHLRFDYAYTDMGSYLGNVHRFGFGTSF